MEKVNKTKVILEGEKEYREALQGMKEDVREFRREIEQLNVALEKEVELLRRLR